MVADSFEQALDSATAEVRTWPKWKRTLMGAATPEDMMAADQERNRKIAEALRLTWTTIQVTDPPPDMGPWPPSKPRIVGPVWLDEAEHTYYEADELDFSLPEWQIKIQERVRGLWCGPEVFMSYEYCIFPPRLHRIYLWAEEGKPKKVFSGGSSQVVWEDALLFLQGEINAQI